MAPRWERRHSCRFNHGRSSEDPFRNLERDVENALLQNQQHNQLLLLQLQCVRLTRSNDALKLKLEVREQELWNERERSLNEQRLRLMAEVEVERLLPPKRRQSFCSTQAPDDEHGDQEVEADESARDVSPAREDAQGEEQHVDDGQALAKPEDAEQRMCTDEGMMSIFAGESESTGSKSSCQEHGQGEDRADAACQTHGEDCTAVVDSPESQSSAMVCSYPMALESLEVGGGLGGECAPHDLLVTELLPYLNVEDLLNWRLLSRHTRSPQALIDHVAEMGSMERPESVLDFGEKVKAMRNPDTSFAAVFGGNVAQQKLYDCRWWCFALACKRRTHFAESHVQRIVGKNLRSLLWHCQSANDSISESARQLLVYSCHASYVADGLPFAQRFIANYLLDLMENIVESHISANLKDIGPCLKALAMVLRSMSKPQRQKWVSLLVQLLTDYKLPKENAQVAIWRLRMLWMADDDPTRTYAESQHDLRTVAAAFPYNKDLAGDIRLLIHYSCS